MLTVYDALMMSPERRGTLVEVFLNPEEYQAFLAEQSMKEALYDDYMAAVTFTDDDLFLGSIIVLFMSQGPAKEPQSIES